MSEFKRGDQIKYNPGHCDVEYGFVTEVRKFRLDIGEPSETIFCRFWSNYQAGQLRTMANSESCNARDIKKCVTDIPESIINAWLKHLGY